MTMASFSGYTDEQLEDLINKVYNGVIAPESLPVDLYVIMTNKLMEGVFDGFGGNFESFDIESPFYDLLAEYEVNIQVFSAAKTFQEVRFMSDFLFIDGVKTPFAEFREIATKVFETFDNNWLKTEYRTGINRAFGGNKWVESTQDVEFLPMLKYQTVGDERVRPQHADLDNIVKPVSDPFWNTYFPPNGWNCRCIVEQLEADEEPVTKTTFQGKGRSRQYFDSQGNPIEKPPKLFADNPGKTKVIFKGTGPDQHPYFKVEDRFKQKKRRNFDLPLRPKRTTIPE